MGMKYEVAPQRWQRAGAEVGPSDVAYECPTGGLDPFDVTEPGTQRLFEARGLGRAWVTTPEADSAAWKQAWEGGVPMGYRTLSLLEKQAVVAEGLLVAEWDAGREPERGSLPASERTWWVLCRDVHDVNRWAEETGRTFRGVARDATSPSQLPRVAGDRLTLPADSYHQALLLALTLGERLGGALMVARLLDRAAWH